MVTEVILYSFYTTMFKKTLIFSVYVLRLNKCRLQAKHVFVCVCDDWSSSSDSLIMCFVLILISMNTCDRIIHIIECVMNITNMFECFLTRLFALIFLVSTFFSAVIFWTVCWASFSLKWKSRNFSHLFLSFRWTDDVFVNGGQTKAACSESTFPLIQAVFVFKPH